MDGQIADRTSNAESLPTRGVAGIGPDDRVVVVLGAGASIGEMKAAKSGAVPPADRDFLDVASKHCRRRYSEVCKLFDEVWEDAPPYKLVSPQMRMEQLFASCYLKVRQTDGRSEAGRAARELYDAIIILMRETLVETTDMADPPHHTRLLRTLWDAQPGALSVVALNYDVLADRALLSLNDSGALEWGHRYGYGFWPRGTPAVAASPSVTLLKLHGSVNWYIELPNRRRHTAYDTRAQIYIPQPCYRPGRPAWKNRQNTRGHSDTPVFPLLVPPVFEKSTQISGTIAKLWGKAERALSTATLVIFWGYSLPVTDYHSEILFAQTARRAKYNLIVINPDRGALAHVTDVCGHAWTRWFFGVEDFFEFADRGWR